MVGSSCIVILIDYDVGVGEVWRGVCACWWAS